MGGNRLRTKVTLATHERLCRLRAGDDTALKDEVLELVAGWLQYGGDDLGRLCRNLREAIALPRARDDPGATPVAATPVGGQN